MSKGKFEPGKRVLLLRNSGAFTSHLVGTEQTLEFRVPSTKVCRPQQEMSEKWWRLEGCVSSRGRGVSWHEDRMILLDPDESPEQSAEAMRNLYSFPQKVTA